MTTSISQIITETLSGSSIYAAVLGTSLFVGIGYLITKKGLFTKETNGRISRFVFAWVLPFVGITSFMQRPDPNVANVLGIVLGLSIGFYFIGILVSWAVVKYAPALVSQSVINKSYQMWIQQNPDGVMEKHKEYYISEFRKKLIIGQQLVLYSQITFFALPLVRALPDVFGTSGVGLLWIWHITFSVLVFSHLRFAVSGQKIQKSEIGPIIKSIFNLTLIFTLLSLALWAIQFAFPDQRLGEWFVPTGNATGSSFWDLSVTLPVIYRPLSIGVALLSPLIWLVIGGSLAGSDFKVGIRDKSVWTFTILKLVVIPLILFLVMLGLVSGGVLDAQTSTLLVVIQAAPPAVLTTVYAVKWNVRPDYSSQITSLSTVIALVSIPIWVIVSRIVFQAIAS